VLLTNVVGSATPFSRIVLSLGNPDPVTVTVTAVDPAGTSFGEIALMVIAGVAGDELPPVKLAVPPQPISRTKANASKMPENSAAEGQRRLTVLMVSCKSSNPAARRKLKSSHVTVVTGPITN
jgi:hypothetical protein